MSGTGRFNRWWLAAAVAVLLLAALGWQCRPEALRQRLQAAIQQQVGRPVRIDRLRFAWHEADARRSTGSGATLEVLLDRVDVPSQDRRRGLSIDRLSFLLRPAVNAWWHAWRDGTPWPVQAIEAQGLVTVPLSGLLDDGYGRWEFGWIRLDGVVADAAVPRTASLQMRGRWRREQDGIARTVPIKGEFHEVAVSLPRDAAPRLSVERARLGVGMVDFSLERLVADEATATFNVVLDPVNLRAALPALGVAVPDTTDGHAFTRFSLRGDCHGDETGMGCSGLEMELDDTRLRGQARQGKHPSSASSASAPWRLQLHADQLDLDRYLPPDNPSEPPFDVPWSKADAWPVEAELTVDRLRVGGMRFRGARLSLRAGEHGLATR